MKIRLLEKGWETFTGLLGVVQFENGVSVGEVSEFDLRRIAGQFRVAYINGRSVSLKQNATGAKAPVGRSTKRGKNNHEKVGGNDSEFPSFYHDEDIPTKTVHRNEQPKEPAEPRKIKELQPTIEVTTRYSKEELMEIADKEGIAGLRLIAEPLLIKGTSINKLIEEILAVAGKQ